VPAFTEVGVAIGVGVDVGVGDMLGVGVGVKGLLFFGCSFCTI
jgi:hypothetical protein